MELSIRLALRREGSMWNAYLAEQGVMDNAIPLGSIAIGIVEKNPDLKQKFQDLMTEVLARVIEDTTGQTPTMEIRPAPEHEKSGNA